MSTQFSFSNIRYITQHSREIGSDAPPRRVGVSSANAVCACGHRWTAINGRDLRGVIGGVHVQCPVCRADAVIRGGELGI
jgi:hypothetical protein